MSPEQLAALQDTAQRLSRDGYSAECRQIEEAILHIRESHATILTLQRERRAAIDEVMRLRAAQPPPGSLDAKVGAVLIGDGFLDRMKDLTADDTPARIVADFLRAVRPLVSEHRRSQTKEPSRAIPDDRWIKHADCPGSQPGAVGVGCECTLCGSKLNNGSRVYCTKDGCPGYAAEMAERAPPCPGCEGHPAESNDPCLICGRSSIDTAPQLCGHHDGNLCDETCAEKARAFREYHGLPPKGLSDPFANAPLTGPGSRLEAQLAEIKPAGETGESR